MKSLITAQSQKYHIDPELLIRIAVCESGLNPNIKNPASSASGIFQFLNSTFLSQATKYGLPLDKNNPEIQAELAARMISDGGLRHWKTSASCWDES